MTYDARAITRQCLSLAGAAVGTFVATVAMSAATGVGLAIASWFALSDSSWGHRAAAAGLAIAEGIAAGLFLGTKRAVADAIERGLASFQVGRTIVGLVFDRMLRLQTANGAESSLENAWVDRAQAERRLNDAIREVERTEAGEGVLQQTIVRRLLSAVRKYVIRRFASETSLIDLRKIRAEAESAIDDRLIARFRSGTRLTTLLVVVALPLVAALQIWLLGKIAF